MIVDDFKCNGLWVKTKEVAGVRTETRSYATWASMRTRCKLTGAARKRKPTYIDCRMSENFKDFQYFTTWSHSQIGFNCGMHLDKDLLIKGNKIYGENTCLFLPGKVNNLLTKCSAARGSLPIGVSTTSEKYLLPYTSFVRVNSKSFYLGTFSTPEEAFRVYKEAKELLCKQMAEEYKNRIDPRAYVALTNYVVDITD